MNEGKWTLRSRSENFGVIVFSLYVAAGAGYIVWSKISGHSPFVVTAVPLILMTTYATLLGFARYLHLRDDQAGDNLYYLGFLYTLTSLGVSLWQFSATDGGEGIVTSFGVAISSTILGVTFRVIFNQMRQDPAEVEQTARLELAESARRIKQELDSTIFEFSSFRRSMQQSLEESFEEIRGLSNGVTEKVLSEMREFPARSIAPIESASLKTKDAIERMSNDLTGQLGRTGQQLTTEEERLASAAAKVRDTLASIDEGLRAMKNPEGIIEIKLQPFIRGFTKAVNDQAAAATDQMIKLQSIIGQFDETVRGLAKQLGEAEGQRRDEYGALRESLGRTEQTTRDLQRNLAEIEQKPMVVPTERSRVFGWLGGGP